MSCLWSSQADVVFFNVVNAKLALLYAFRAASWRVLKQSGRTECFYRGATGSQTRDGVCREVEDDRHPRV